MARKSNHKTIIFLQDYANKQVGDELTCDSMLAGSIVQRGYARYKGANQPPVPEENKGATMASVSDEKPKSKPQSSFKNNKKK